jgi:hypothetical protein
MVWTRVSYDPEIEKITILMAGIRHFGLTGQSVVTDLQ